MVEFSATKDDKDPKFDNLHSFNIQEKGFEPVFVPEGSVIDIIVRCPGKNSFCYIYSGYPDVYKNIEGQEYDFTTIRCGMSLNLTTVSKGLLPGVLYFPA